MQTHISKLFAAAVLAGGLGLASSAHAVWTFTSATTSSNNAVAPNITSISGAYVTNGANNTGFAAGATWTSSALSYNNPGLGMDTDGTQSPQHAIDNNGRTEAALIGFQSSVVLSSIGLSWTYDSMTQGQPVDISLFRYVGGGIPGLTLSPTTMSGWELVGNYGDMQQDTTSPFTSVNSTNKGSSWWLISAYNSGFTGAKETRGTLDNGSDYFKIYALAGTGCTGTAANCGTNLGTVPEPASLALVGAALLGVYGSRRRVAAKR